MNVIESAVLTELYDKHGLDSLKVQNHIYGCFILMEDIAESAWKKENSLLRGQDGLVYHLDAQFSEIGIRYGFLMDTHLDYMSYSPEYKRAWLDCFDYVGQSHDMSFVETVEDHINTIIQNNIKHEDAYFMNALEHGVLSKAWQDKVITLLIGSKTSKLSSVQEAQPTKEASPTNETQPAKEPSPSEEKEEELPSSHLSHAAVEKRMIEKRRTLHKTRRNRSKDLLTLPKQSMSKTRRSVRT
jgi:hypothetical protein